MIKIKYNRWLIIGFWLLLFLGYLILENKEKFPPIIFLIDNYPILLLLLIVCLPFLLIFKIISMGYDEEAKIISSVNPELGIRIARNKSDALDLLGQPFGNLAIMTDFLGGRNTKINPLKIKKLIIKNPILLEYLFSNNLSAMIIISIFLALISTNLAKIAHYMLFAIILFIDIAFLRKAYISYSVENFIKHDFYKDFVGKRTWIIWLILLYCLIMIIFGYAGI
jgi:hypothetical protein